MKRTVIRNIAEQNVLTAMIMSKDFLNRTSSLLNEDWTENPLVKQVAGWCIKHFRRYKKAPRQNIKAIYTRWADNEKTKPEAAEAVADFLENLSEIFDKKRKLNVPFIQDEFRRMIQRQKLKKHIEQLSATMDDGNFEEAETAAAAYKATEIGDSTSVDVLRNRDAWIEAFAEPETPLIEFPSEALSRFFGGALSRDALIGIQGPEKRGKTWCCIEFAMRALRQRRKVAFFETGDLSQRQIMKRLGVVLTGRPQFQNQLGKIKIPKSFIDEEYRNKRIADDDEEDGERQQELPKMNYTKKKLTKTISAQSCINSARRKVKLYMLPEGVPFFKLSVHSNRTVNVRQIDAIIERWKNEDGFVPDVIIIDYADILAPEDSRQDKREQTNETWQALRRLSQDWHCLVISPTQATRESYDASTQAMKHASEDKRKNAHVTGMLGLNQKGKEKAEGLMRLNWVALREAPFDESKCLWVGQCLTLGRFICCGKF